MTAVVPPGNRGPGLIDSGDMDITGTIGHAVDSNTVYVLTALMNPNDVSDTTITLSGLTIYLDDIAVWGPNDWKCGTTDRNGNPFAPYAAYGDGRTHSTVRVAVTLPKAMNFGLDVSGGTLVK